MLRRLWFCWAVVAGVLGARAADSAFYVNYDQDVPTAPLRLHAVSIVHPDADVDLAAAHAAGNRVLAYLSVGEVASDASYRTEAMDRGLELRGRNEIWNSDVLNLSDGRWLDLLVDQVAQSAVARGFDGFFLDTLDSVDAKDRDALIELVGRLRDLVPAGQIIANRGFGFLDALAPLVDGVMAESVFGTVDLVSGEYRPVSSPTSAQLIQELKKWEGIGLQIYVLDYADPGDAERAREISESIAALGWSAFVSTPDLRGSCLGPWRQVPRRVFSLYGNLATELIDQVKWPADSFTALRLQTPLEWLGYEVDYGKVTVGGKLPNLGPDTAAIVLPRGLEIPLASEAMVVDWLLDHKSRGFKVLIFGGLPFVDETQRERFMRGFDLAGDGSVVLPVTSLEEVVANEGVLAGAEIKARILPTDFLNLQAEGEVRVMRAVKGRNPVTGEVRMDAIFSAEWGGVALDPYVIFQRPDFREFWHFDIFAFLETVLGRVDAPLPDSTTRMGRRMFLSHIDGDGFINGSETAPGKYSAEVVRDEILKKYPVPITVSVIEAEVTANVTSVSPDLRPKFEAIARDIFELPNVQMASHSFSHPFMWMPGDRTAYLYKRPRLDLREPYPEMRLEREIDGSVAYINEHLAPDGKQVEVFLWSGNCRPPPEALRRVHALGLVAMNGGDTLISRRVPTINAVAPRSIPWGDQVQVFAPAQNENVYTNDWEGPHFGTFMNVIETFERTESPRRLKPVNIYYHFYSGDFFSSLRALQVIHEWAMHESLHSVTVRDYVHLAEDARAIELFKRGNSRWAMVGRGDLQTYRVPRDWEPRLDLKNSSGLMGWNAFQDDVYLHTDGSAVVELRTTARSAVPESVPRLQYSTGDLEFNQRSGELWDFVARDLRPVDLAFAGLPPQSEVSFWVGGEDRTEHADAAGRIELTVPANARIKIRWSD